MLDQGCFLESLTAVDLRDSFTLVYHFASLDELCRTVVHVLPGQEDRQPTISQIYPAADWYEREVYDLFGINFCRSSQPEALLLPEDADFHPLLKDFQSRGGQ